MTPHKTLARLVAAGFVTVAAAEVRGVDPPPAAPAFRAVPAGGTVPGWQPQFRPGAGAENGWKPAAPATSPLSSGGSATGGEGVQWTQPHPPTPFPKREGGAEPESPADSPPRFGEGPGEGSPPAAKPHPTFTGWQPAVQVEPAPAPDAPVIPVAVTEPAGPVAVPVTAAETPAVPVPTPVAPAPEAAAPAAPPAAGPAPVPAPPQPAEILVQPPTPSLSQPSGSGTSSTSPSATGAPSAGGGPSAAPKPPKPPEPPQTWHGHKYPVLPFAPPGAAPIAPTGPGYYTLLACVRGECQEKPPRWPYPRGGPFPHPFPEIDFTYLDKIPFEERDWAEKLKRIPLGDSFLFSTGGELRYRWNHETNSRLTGATNTYDLFRNRLYADLWYENTIRLYTEFLYGDTINQDLPPLGRDVNRGDIQQLFADLRLCDVDGNPIYARVGRQELSYGSQRLISANDWGNVRARFDGLKLFYRSEKLDVDSWLTRPTQARAAQLDPWDRNQTFSGLWATYKPKKGTFIDLYYLNLENDNPGVARGQFRTGSFNISTLGARYYSRFDSGLLLDFEGMQQFGHWADQTVLAQALSAYVGWNFKDCWAKPTVWAGYDYASGDPNPNNTGQHRTFNQLFTFGHYYLGFTDVVARQNIRDWNIQAYAYPAEWLTAGAQYHVFRLDSNADALYSAAGAVLRQDRTGKAGNDVGSEIDLLVNFHLTDRQDIFVNYSHLFTGSFIKATGPGMPLDYVYLQYSMRW